MPASASSPITVLSAEVGCGEREPDADLLVALGEVPDLRKARVCRHRLVTVLAVSVAAVLPGTRSYVAIAEWAHDLPATARLRLGIGRCAPSESAIRRILQTVDLDALNTALSAWLASRLSDSSPSPQDSMSAPVTRMIAVDGKTARGAHRLDGPATHLLAASGLRADQPRSARHWAWRCGGTRRRS